MANRKRHQTQLTLFDYQAKDKDERSKLADGSAHHSQQDSSTGHGDDGSHESQSLDNHSADLEYSDSELSDMEDTRYQYPASPASCTLQSKYDQENMINIDKPSGSTTIIINNGQSAPGCSNPSGTHSAQAQTISTAKFPTDIAQGPLQSPVQPCMNFPATTLGSKRRSFNSEWYKKYKWLEYSAEKDSAFCYPCRFFGTAT